MLRQAGVGEIQGFFVNSTHFDWTSNEIRYGEQISRLTRPLGLRLWFFVALAVAVGQGIYIVYSLLVLPPFWQKVTLFNPVVYLVSGFRWSFFNIADVSVNLSLGMTAFFLVLCMLAVWWIFKTGYRLKN